MKMKTIMKAGQHGRNDCPGDIIKKSKTVVGSIEVTLSWPPSISFPVNIGKKGSNASKSGSMFIGSLATFGLTKRKYRPDMFLLRRKHLK